MSFLQKRKMFRGKCKPILWLYIFLFCIIMQEALECANLQAMIKKTVMGFLEIRKEVIEVLHY